MRLSKTALLLAAAGSLSPGAPAALGQTWNAGPDLAANEKPDGGAQELANPNATVPQWSYGHRETAFGSGLTLFAPPTEHTNNANGGDENLEGWSSPGLSFSIPIVLANVSGGPISPFGSLGSLSASELLVHPQNEGDPRTFPVVRWTAPAAGTYDIVSAWRDLDAGGGSGAEAFLVRNGTVDFNQAFVNGGSTSDSTTETLAAGDTIDFVVGPGPGGDFGFDSTAFSATITLVPEPAGLGLLASGGLLALRRRRGPAVRA